eukprot:172752-Chlamydomonas_euryale.AAC.3
MRVCVCACVHVSEERSRGSRCGDVCVQAHVWEARKGRGGSRCGDVCVQATTATANINASTSTTTTQQPSNPCSAARTYSCTAPEALRTPPPAKTCTASDAPSTAPVKDTHRAGSTQNHPRRRHAPRRMHLVPSQAKTCTAPVAPSTALWQRHAPRQKHPAPPHAIAGVAHAVAKILLYKHAEHVTRAGDDMTPTI